MSHTSITKWSIKSIGPIRTRQSSVPQHNPTLGKSISIHFQQKSNRNIVSLTKKDDCFIEGGALAKASTQRSNEVRTIIAHLETTDLALDPVKSSATLDNTRETLMEETHLRSSKNMPLSSEETRLSPGGSQKEISLDHQQIQVVQDVRVDEVLLLDGDGSSLLTMVLGGRGGFRVGGLAHTD